MRKEFKWTLHCLRIHLRVEKSMRGVNKRLLSKCVKENIGSEKYRNRLRRDLRLNDVKIIELTRAIKILNR